MMESIWMILTLVALVTGQTKDLANVGTDLGFNLYGEAAKEADNVFLSPYSISTALALTYQGANGDTEQEMSDVLGFSKLSTSNINSEYQTLNNAIFGTKEYTLKTANRLFGRTGTNFLRSYLNLLQEYYNATLKQKDFLGQPEKSRQEINEWVEESTEDKIKELLPQGSIDSSTVLVLVNAIYFKGNWVQQFKEEDTKDEYFQVSNNERVKVPMMNLGYKMLKIYHDRNMKATILQLPYDGNGDDEIDINDDVAMYIILPDETEGLDDVTRDLDSSKVNTMKESMSSRLVASVKLPRFNITQLLSLKSTLKSLGMPKAFSSAADFSGMTGINNLYIDDVYHKAVVEVNEKGTTAAAGTGAVIVPVSAGLKFEADHPFLFLICEENTGSTLFMGRVHNPITATLEANAASGDLTKDTDPDSGSISLWPCTFILAITAILSLQVL